MNEYEVILVVKAVNDKASFEKSLKKEGFSPIDGEEFAYMGKAHLPLMNTRAFIFDVLSKAVSKDELVDFSFVCQLGENTMEKYRYADGVFVEF